MHLEKYYYYHPSLLCVSMCLIVKLFYKNKGITLMVFREFPGLMNLRKGTISETQSIRRIIAVFETTRDFRFSQGQKRKKTLSGVIKVTTTYIFF